MSSSKNHKVIDGSERTPMPGSHASGPANPRERIEVTIRLNRRNDSREDIASVIEKISKHHGEHRHLSHEEFAASYGAHPNDIRKILAFAHDHDLTVVESSVDRRSVMLSGTIEDINRAFDVELTTYHHADGDYRGHHGPIHVPAEIHDIVEGVFGLDNRRQIYPHIRRLHQKDDGKPKQIIDASYTPPDLAKLYDFPDADGEGQCIALIELGGGYRAADLKKYFSKLGVPAHQVTAVSVDHTHNSPVGEHSNEDGEVLLDIEVAAAIAPKASIVVYFSSSTEKGFLDAVTKAIHDKNHKPSIISISWGASESVWSAQTMKSVENAFQSAVVLGITVVCSSGDNGSNDRVGDGKAHVDFPASSPHVLSCGGTRLMGKNKVIESEVVWNNGPGHGATGGGVSEVFAVPGYQGNANVPPSANPGNHKGRGVPDVAGNADPETGYEVLINGNQQVIGGTSAVAPLWAGLIALINQKLKQNVGFINPHLYNHPANLHALRKITKGTNGAYHACEGWSACTGLGTPNGAAVMNLLSTVSKQK